MQHARAERAVVLEPRQRPPRHDLQLEGHARGERADGHRLVVDRHDPLAPLHLLLQQVLQQVAALRALRVGGEALALARHGRRHERQRVELRVGVRQRGAGLAALVHDHVHVRGRRVLAHALAPHAHRGLDLLGLELGERRHRPRASSRSPRARRAPAARRTAPARRVPRPAGPVPGVRLAGRQRRVEVRHHAHPPARAVRRACRPGAGRRPRAASGPRGPPRTGPRPGRSAARSGTRARRPGRVPRSPATITRSPESGSMRSSGKALLHGHVLDALLLERLAGQLVAVA